jgi:ubiquinone/menaquinone biosynthesis C-methylase UbiE
MTPEINKILSQVPPNYYSKGVKTNLLQKLWHGKKWNTLKNLLEAQPKGALLDIGCADGTTTAEIKKAFPHLKVTGLDYYKEAINFAKKTKPHINFVIGDAHNLPFKGASFDTVTIIETLEHLLKPELVLSEVRRVLKKGGTLIIGQDTDSFLFKIVWFLWTKAKGSVWQNSHISCMRPKKLQGLVKKSGFQIKDINYINLGMEVFIKAQKK